MELTIASRTITDEKGVLRQFRYALLIDELSSGCFFCENYGVLISETNGDNASIPGITSSAARIDELMTLLIKHNVSPTSLADVVADWL